MAIYHRFILCCCVLLGLLLFPLSAAGEINGMVTLVQEDSIKVNRGQIQGVEPDMELFVYRLGKPIAKVKVYQVDDYSSWSRAIFLTAGEAVRVGDVVSTEPMTPSFAASAPPPQAPSPAPPPSQDAASTAPLQNTPVPQAPGPASLSPGGSPPQAQPALNQPAPLVRGDRGDEVTKRYEKKCQQNTRRFSISVKGKGTISVSPFDVLNLLSTTSVLMGSGYASSINPWYLGTIGADMYSRYQYSKGQSQGTSSSIDVVYWDPDLADIYADYVCLKEASTDEDMRQAMRKDVYNQKGLDRSIVFYVIVNNKGPGVMQLAPFSWHMYLLAKDGSRIKAEKYDEVLDRALNPNSDTKGYIYFPRYDVNGQPVLGNGPVKIQLEEIMGKKAVLEFK
jgi:hypothetical protein